MSEWAVKRFWKEARTVPLDGGFGIRLDDRPLKTPAKEELVLPTEPLAERVAEEWQAAEAVIDPTSMVWTRSANSAIDKVIPQRDEVEDHLIGYAGTDLLCYRADGPAGLIERQADAWDPLLGWASESYAVSFAVTTGVMPVDQPPETGQRLRGPMAQMSAFQLTGFHDLVTLSGSYVIALAVISGQDSVEALWRASRVDETFQAEQWGVDEEAEELAEIKRDAFLHAANFFRLAK